MPACSSTSSTRPTSCSGRTSRRARRSSGATASRCRASRGCRPAALPPPRGGRHARRLRHGPGHRVLPERPLPGLQVVGRDAARAARPVPDRRGGRRGARDRPLADGRVRGRRRDRRRRRPVRRRRRGRPRSSSARPTRTWPSCVGDDRIVLWDRRRRHHLRRRRGPREVGRAADRRSPTGSALVGDSSDGFPGIPGWGAKSAAAVLTRYGHSRRSRRRRRPGRCPGSAARAR